MSDSHKHLQPREHSTMEQVNDQHILGLNGPSSKSLHGPWEMITRNGTCKRIPAGPGQTLCTAPVVNIPTFLQAG